MPEPMEYLDVFPREHKRWAVRHPARRTLAVLVDGTPCDVVNAGMRRIRRASKLLDLVRQLTTADRVPMRDEFTNVGGGIGGVSGHRVQLAIGIEKTDDPLWLLERLNQPVQQNPVKTAIMPMMLSLWCS
jgi:hypothetical protein